MDSIKLLWQEMPSEKDAANKVGETLSREDIKIANTPMGQFWVGRSQLTTNSGQMIPLPYKICFNGGVLADAFKSQEEAITAIEKHYTESALQIHAQVEEFKKSQVAVVPAVDAELVENANP